MKLVNHKYFACDFETTVYEGQKDTLVWSSASVQISTPNEEIETDPKNVVVLGSIESQIEYFAQQNCTVVAYYHNLKFDGSFYIDYFLRNGFTLALEGDRFKKEYELKNKEYKYVISDRGAWYTIVYKLHGNIVELRDSLKLLPFSLRELGDAFQTKYRKLDMEYKGFRYPNCPITQEELAYIKNDVLVLKESLEQMFSRGHNKLTIGSCCLAQYKRTIYGDDKTMYPDLTLFPLDEEIFGAKNADEYVRKSYKGGWCYVKRGCENTPYENGLTADVNSLYPSRMHSESGCKYPIGKPQFWVGDIPEKALSDNMYFFVTIRCRFHLKPNHLPFIQIKRNPLYRGTEMLETSDILYNGEYISEFEFAGERRTSHVTLTLTMTDYYLFLEHYDVIDFEVLHGCYFYAAVGIFDDYINYWAEVKQKSKGVMRTIAKLFLNNLYGKMASSDESSFKVAFLDEEQVKFKYIEAHDKKVGYIPVGSAITSYAREFTIRTAQKNYKYFIYADTDSIHCNCTPEQLVGVPVDPVKFNHWKLETYWDSAIFTRQKTYIEHVTHEDGEKVDKPYYNVKCAGMPQRCKDLFVQSITQEWTSLTQEELNKQYNQEEQVFIKKKRTLKDFCIGLEVPSKLVAKRIRGGVLLCDSHYIMHDIK